MSGNNGIILNEIYIFDHNYPYNIKLNSPILTIMMMLKKSQKLQILDEKNRVPTRAIRVPNIFFKKSLITFFI